MDYKIILGENIKKQRKRSGLSQTEIANALYVARCTYIRYEKGERYPSFDILLKLSSLCNVSLYDLIKIPQEKEITLSSENHQDIIFPASLLYDNEFLKIFDQLTEKEKSYIIKLMNMLIADHT